MNLKNILPLILFSYMSFTSTGQTGIQFYGGISNATNKDIQITPEGQSHAGYHIGADARLLEGNMYFVLGGQYHNIEFVAKEDKNYFSVANKMKWLKMRVGLGFQVFKLSDAVIFRAKSLVSFNFITDIPTDIVAPYTNYNSGTLGGVLGIGIDAFNITFDVEYEKGFFKAVNLVSGTEVNFFTMSLGYKI